MCSTLYRGGNVHTHIHVQKNKQPVKWSSSSAPFLGDGCFMLEDVLWPRGWTVAKVGGEWASGEILSSDRKPLGVLRQDLDQNALFFFFFLFSRAWFLSQFASFKLNQWNHLRINPTFILFAVPSRIIKSSAPLGPACVWGLTPTPPPPTHTHTPWSCFKAVCYWHGWCAPGCLYYTASIIYMHVKNRKKNDTDSN